MLPCEHRSPWVAKVCWEVVALVVVSSFLVGFELWLWCVPGCAVPEHALTALLMGQQSSSCRKEQGGPMRPPCLGGAGSAHR